MSYPCRCRRACCQARQTIAKHPDEYLRPRRCRSCRKGALRVDKYRSTRRENPKSVTCNCAGYSFPHHRGRGWCDHNHKLTADDLEKRHSYA